MNRFGVGVVMFCVGVCGAFLPGVFSPSAHAQSRPYDLDAGVQVQDSAQVGWCASWPGSVVRVHGPKPCTGVDAAGQLHPEGCVLPEQVPDAGCEAHCWHYQRFTYSMHSAHYDRTCCWCARRECETGEHVDHGPYAPDGTTTWAPKGGWKPGREVTW